MGGFTAPDEEAFFLPNSMWWFATSVVWRIWESVSYTPLAVYKRQALTRFRFARLCTKLVSANAACKTRVNMKCVRASQRRVVRVAVRPHGTDYIAGTTEVTPGTRSFRMRSTPLASRCV